VRYSITAGGGEVCNSSGISALFVERKMRSDNGKKQKKEKEE
jgi:hypothetical protein